jgi:hypothetical protein
VLGAVAADAEVGGLILSEFLLEEGLLAVPAGGDGISQEHDFGFALLGDREEALVRAKKRGQRLAVRTWSRRGDVGWLGRKLENRRGGLLGRSLLSLLSDEGGAA